MWAIGPNQYQWIDKVSVLMAIGVKFPQEQINGYMNSGGNQQCYVPLKK